jgi:NodT family efflux transporter outer membrane factor (OMF) lipoprotein
MRHLLLLAGTALALCGCMVGPDYHRPDAITSAAFKESPPAGWKLSSPSDAIDKGAWWSVYNDPVLDRLEREIDISNQTVKQAEAAYREASSIVQVTRGSLFPSVSVSPGATVVSSSSKSSTVINGLSSGQNGARTNYSLEGNATWDPDVWGRIRRTVESDMASAQVSAADLANARLSAQAALATDYFELRSQDSLQALLNDTVTQDTRALQITQNQYAAGTAARSDVITAQTQLQTVQAAAINVGVARSQFEHAIAVLTGHPPADLSLDPAPLTNNVPVIPMTMPTTLLERRPDIAAAERAMAQENALVGVAIAAYYPNISLTALAGYSGNPIGSLLNASNQLWSLGASATQSLYAGGAITAQVREARAAFDASVANYRQVVLTAFQQVEDDLSGLRILEQQAAAEAIAVQSAQQAVQIAMNEYRAGTQPYTTVVTAQTTELTNQQTLLLVQQDRMIDSVALIEALGGGWDATQLPDQHTLRGPLIPLTP